VGACIDVRAKIGFPHLLLSPPLVAISLFCHSESCALIRQVQGATGTTKKKHSRHEEFRGQSQQHHSCNKNEKEKGKRKK
jgi:hypothetical protein